MVNSFETSCINIKLLTGIWAVYRLKVINSTFQISITENMFQPKLRWEKELYYLPPMEVDNTFPAENLALDSTLNRDWFKYSIAFQTCNNKI